MHIANNDCLVPPVLDAPDFNYALYKLSCGNDDSGIESDPGKASTQDAKRKFPLIKVFRFKNSRTRYCLYAEDDNGIDSQRLIVSAGCSMLEPETVVVNELNRIGQNHDRTTNITRMRDYEHANQEGMGCYLTGWAKADSAHYTCRMSNFTMCEPLCRSWNYQIRIKTGTGMPVALYSVPLSRMLPSGSLEGGIDYGQMDFIRCVALAFFGDIQRKHDLIGEFGWDNLLDESSAEQLIDETLAGRLKMDADDPTIEPRAIEDNPSPTRTVAFDLVYKDIITFADIYRGMDGKATLYTWWLRDAHG